MHCNDQLYNRVSPLVGCKCNWHHICLNCLTVACTAVWASLLTMQASRPREAAEGDGIASSQDLLLQSAASLPPLLLNGSTSPPGAGTLDQQQHHQGLQTGAGSLQHSLSCPQTEYRSSSKGAQSLQRSLTNSRQQQQQDRAHMVRTSDPQHAVLQLPAGTHAGNGRNSDGSSDQQLALALPGEQQITAWARPGSPAGQHQQQLSPAHTHSNGAGMQHHHQHHHQQHQQLELERRKFTRNLLSANNKKESLERYKAIMALIEACKRRLEVQLGPAGGFWDVCWEGAAPWQSRVTVVMRGLVSVGGGTAPRCSGAVQVELRGRACCTCPAHALSGLWRMFD